MITFFETFTGEKFYLIGQKKVIKLDRRYENASVYSRRNKNDNIVVPKSQEKSYFSSIFILSKTET